MVFLQSFLVSFTSSARLREISNWRVSERKIHHSDNLKLAECVISINTAASLPITSCHVFTTYFTPSQIGLLYYWVTAFLAIKIVELELSWNGACSLSSTSWPWLGGVLTTSKLSSAWAQLAASLVPPLYHQCCWRHGCGVEVGNLCLLLLLQLSVATRSRGLESSSRSQLACVRNWPKSERRKAQRPIW
jgi:hypothetical protein